MEININDKQREIIKNIINNPSKELTEFKKEIYKIAEKSGIQMAFNAILRTDAALKIRKPSIAIYDHTFHIIGGGQKYGLTIANALQKDFDITLISNREISIQNILKWYDLDLSNCKIKIIKIPFFEKSLSHIDPGMISKRVENPFHIISKEAGNYDIFINNSMNEMVYPLSNISMIICHFPERRPTSYFYADKYSYVIFNSKYTAEWIKKKWKFQPNKHIYPPVDMETSFDKTDKENIILSVARFEISGSKKQMEMVRAFTKLNKRYPEILKSWKLILAGGSQKDNQYLQKIQDFIKSKKTTNIEIKINISVNELKSLYNKSKFFWHLCGLDQTDPSLIEHFGMTIVEAMQNRLVPIVFDGGGQREIVDHGISGFRVKSISELITYSIKLITNQDIMKNMSINSYKKSKLFTREAFDIKVKSFFYKILEDYISI